MSRFRKGSFIVMVTVLFITTFAQTGFATSQNAYNNLNQKALLMFIVDEMFHK